jgi:hypothetical protein
MGGGASGKEIDLALSRALISSKDLKDLKEKVDLGDFTYQPLKFRGQF